MAISVEDIKNKLNYIKVSKSLIGDAIDELAGTTNSSSDTLRSYVDKIENVTGTTVTLDENTLEIENDVLKVKDSALGSQVSIATAEAVGTVKPDGTTIKIDNGTISVPTASDTELGLVKIDNDTITLDENGAIKAISSGSEGSTVSIATTSTVGNVKPDDTTIEIDENGTLSFKENSNGYIDSIKGLDITNNNAKISIKDTNNGGLSVTPSSFSYDNGLAALTIETSGSFSLDYGKNTISGPNGNTYTLFSYENGLNTYKIDSTMSCSTQSFTKSSNYLISANTVYKAFINDNNKGTIAFDSTNSSFYIPIDGDTIKVVDNKLVASVSADALNTSFLKLDGSNTFSGTFKNKISGQETAYFINCYTSDGLSGPEQFLVGKQSLYYNAQDTSAATLAYLNLDANGFNVSLNNYVDQFSFGSGIFTFKFNNGQSILNSGTCRTRQIFSSALNKNGNYITTSESIYDVFVGYTGLINDYRKSNYVQKEDNLNLTGFEWNTDKGCFGVSVDGTTITINDEGKLVAAGGGSSISAIGDISDVTLTDIADGQSLIWDADNSKWINSTISSGATSINAISEIKDVSLTDITDGQVLVWNSTDSKWKNSTITSGTIIKTSDDTILDTVKIDGTTLTIDENGVIKANITSSSTSTTGTVITQADYDALTDEEKASGTYFISNSYPTLYVLDDETSEKYKIGVKNGEIYIQKA